MVKVTDISDCNTEQKGEDSYTRVDLSLKSVSTPPPPTSHLPVEIWLKVIFFCSAPKPLSQTHKALYTLCLNPLSSAKWLAFQYSTESLYGALWFWSKDSDWRQWIADKKPYLKFPDVRRSTYQPSSLSIKKAMRRYNQGWFYMSRKSRCNRCTGHGLMESRLLDQQYYLQGQNLQGLKDSLTKTLMENTCPFEVYQLAVVGLLVEAGGEFREVLPLMVRYAASVGHSRLLNYLISLASTDYKRFYDPTFEMNQIPLRPDMKDAIFTLLRHSLESRKILYVFLSLNTAILKEFAQDPHDWDLLMECCWTGSSIAQCDLLLETDNQLSMGQICQAIRGASFPLFGNTIKKNLKGMNLIMLERLPDNLLREDEAVIASLVCEIGRDDLILILHEKGITFNHMDGGCLFNATLFGHIDAVKILLDVCHVDPMIYHSGRTIVIGLLLFDHVCLLYALLTCFLSLINQCVCSALNAGQPNIVMLGWSSNTLWCLPVDPTNDNAQSNFFSSIAIFLFFLIAYTFLSLFARFLPLCHSLLLVNRKIKDMRRKVEPSGFIDLENQSSDATL